MCSEARSSGAGFFPEGVLEFYSACPRFLSLIPCPARVDRSSLWLARMRDKARNVSLSDAHGGAEARYREHPACGKGRGGVAYSLILRLDES